MTGPIDRSSGDIYDADYFLHGKQSGKSLYEDYRWLPDLTIPMAQVMVNHCGINLGARVVDFGCARGYLVRALRSLGYDAFGVDVSRWAIANADPEVRTRCKLITHCPPHTWERVEWLIAKDVLEHVPSIQLVIDTLMSNVSGGLFVVVPLSKFDMGKYVIEEYERDVTHIQRYCLATWVNMFLRPGWSVTASYRLPGVKDNYYRPGWERGNGFITCRRVEK